MSHMTPEALAKYNLAHPPQKPKQGRFAPDRQFFLCETADEVAKLEAAGWNTNPFEHDPPYKPEEARHVAHWGAIKFPEAEPEAPKVGRPRKV